MLMTVIIVAALFIMFLLYKEIERWRWAAGAVQCSVCRKWMERDPEHYAQVCHSCRPSYEQAQAHQEQRSMRWRKLVEEIGMSTEAAYRCGLQVEDLERMLAEEQKRV